jgi:branched-chain amino acid transport system permease protein
MRWGFGPEEVFAPRFPGLKGSIAIGEGFFPSYQLITILLGPLIWLALHLLLTRTLFGSRLRAATADSAMLSALGINPKPIMLVVVVLGCALAGLGGALQLPREPANLQMDMSIVVEAFAVVVTGGLGSIGGAMVAALLMGQVHAIGASLFPQATLVLMFLTMGLVLAFKPRGLSGKSQVQEVREAAQVFVNVPVSDSRFALIGFAILGTALWALVGGVYWQSLAGDAFILIIFGISLQAMMALGALVTFGHAAFFGLGAYAVALSSLHWGWSMPVALLSACVASCSLAAVFGIVLVRSSGVYLAMLSLALAQVLWALANQWVDLTGGDNGLIGLQLLAEGDSGSFTVALALLAIFCIFALRRLARSSFGAALQAVRDTPMRAAASGLSVRGTRYGVFVMSATLAGLAGGLFATHKGSVFPSVASVSTSVDVLLVVLLGGLHHLWGTLAGAVVMVWASAELGRNFEYWRGGLGLLVMVIMVWAPQGVMGFKWGARRHGA